MNEQRTKRSWGQGYRCSNPKAFNSHPFFRHDRPGRNRGEKYHRRRWMNGDCQREGAGGILELELLEQLAMMVQDDARLYFDGIRGALTDP